MDEPETRAALGLAGRERLDNFFGTSPELTGMVAPLTDEELRTMKRSGHDPRKVHAAYQAAVANEGAPIVVLAKTIQRIRAW